MLLRKKNLLLNTSIFTVTNFLFLIRPPGFLDFVDHFWYTDIWVNKYYVTTSKKRSEWI